MNAILSIPEDITDEISFFSQPRIALDSGVVGLQVLRFSCMSKWEVHPV
jgi:hypothetical protein